MSKRPFEKFISKAESGSKKKEKIRQEKRKAREEKNAWFEEKKKAQLAAGKPGTPFKRENRAQLPGPRSRKHVETRFKPGRENKQVTVAQPSSLHRVAGSGSSARKVMPHPAPGDAGKRNLSPEPPRIAKELSADIMPLNKYIAWCGVCARRDAAEMIKQGKVTVNGKLVLQPPFRVSTKDEVKVNGKKISIMKNLVYILLNKPKDYITTTHDPQGRKTVMELVKKATTERVFPVGRLDRNTTGVLLLTNDGELAQKFTHPSYEVKKIYEVRLDRPLTKEDFEMVQGGLDLEDGFIRPDTLAYADPRDKSVIGIEIHSGRNRIVRRIFEQLGYRIKGLDRVMYGNFTKKNLERGKWRFLSEKEIRQLKHMNPMKMKRARS